MRITELVSKLDRPVPDKKGGFFSFCPCHADGQKNNRRSLHVVERENKLLFHCFAGCRNEDVVEALGLEMSDLFIDKPRFSGREIIAVYDYTDETGKLVYQVVKYHHPKDFRQRRPDGKGGWLWNTKGINPLPYRLHELKKALEAGVTVYICEGEKDCDNLAKIGLVATTNHGGAGKWKEAHSKHFPAGAEVVILPDNDQPGRDHARKVAGQLIARGCRVKVVDLPGLTAKGDVSDWLAAGGSREGLLQRVSEASYWQAEEPLGELHLTEEFNLTDLGNAERLVYYHGKDLRYCHTWGRWLIWDGRRWKIDDTAEIERRAEDTVRKIYIEASNALEKDERKKIADWARSSESNGRIKAMIERARAKTGVPVLPDQLDADPWLLNCLNGTIDLKSGKLLPHDRKYLITKIIPVEYSPAAECPIWIAFLNKVLNGNGNLITFIQKSIGYSLTGDTREQVIFFLYGTGANGKSSLIDVILSLMGDYGLQTPTETLMLNNDRGGISNDIARLKGARFVAAVEAGEGRRMAEVLVKQLTGGDTVSARFLHQEYFEFKPQCKIFLATNHRPVIKGTDLGIWRRIRMIPFSVTIDESEQDKNLLDKLKAELPGILAWAVRGCMGWQELGLGMPDEVKSATDEYKNEMDTVGQFLEDCAEFHPLAKVKAALLHGAYTKWCSGTGEKELSSRAFSMRLIERGIKKSERTMHGYFWQGLRLIQEETADNRMRA